MDKINDNLSTYESLGLKTDKQAAKSKTLGQEDFMSLMIAQMNHQDPFKPMENGEFLSQMAQFSAVSGLKDIKDSFKSLSESMQSNQALQAASMVGRKVLVPGNSAILNQKESIKGTVALEVATDELLVQVKDPKGSVIKEINLGAQSPGKIDFSWDGKLQDAEESSVDDEEMGSVKDIYATPGKYKIEAYASVDNKKQAAKVLLFDVVESVNVGNANQSMSLNLLTAGQVKMTDVEQIK